MAVGNDVRFAYVSTGSSMPSYPDADTIYFLEEAKEIRVGNRLFANVDMDAIDMATLASVLEAYTVKSIDVTGSGDNVADISFNSASGRITVTKGNLPVLSKGAAPIPSTVNLNPGDYFEVVSDTSVSGHTITDGKTKFKLPRQITNLLVSTSGTTIQFTLIYSDGGTTVIEYTGLGSAAFESTASFATASQGLKADLAMPADNGVATNAQITLKRDPVNAMEAATKNYVDVAVAGASSNLNFLGASSTPITDGGTESPTINGVVIPASSLNKGDWVIYDGLQYIWDELKWDIYGGRGDVPKERRVDAGEGLTGGGTLANDVTISHATKFQNDVIDNITDDLQVVGAISYDKFGHIIAVGKKDLTSRVTAIVTPVANAVSDLAGRLNGNYYTSAEVDEAIGTAMSGVPDIIDDEVEEKVATSSEFNEMLQEVFPN